MVEKERIEEIIKSTRVIPVLTIGAGTDARVLAKTLVDCGLEILEVTLRTDQALDAIAVMSEVPGAVVGAGTLRSPSDLAKAQQAGAVFGLSPGSPRELLVEAHSQGFPFVPGVSSATESMVATDLGYSIQKFFPAESIGGISALRALAGPFPETRFCPTGGVSEENFRDYLSLKNVACVGGSWITPNRLVLDSRWDEIRARALRAVGPVRSDLVDHG